MNIDFGQIALVLLAAGHSRRFGKPKLGESLHGKMLAHHAASTLSAPAFAYKFAVVGDNDWGLGGFGFELVHIKAASQSESIAAGVTAARKVAPQAIIIALADMPFVPLEHYARLVSAFDGRCVASFNGSIYMPPAIFGPDHFEALDQLQGDTGAKALLQNALHVAADAGELADIDTPEQLADANQRWVAK